MKECQLIRQNIYSVSCCFTFLMNSSTLLLERQLVQLKMVVFRMFTLIIEVVRSSETLVSVYQATRLCIPADRHFYTRRCENIKSKPIQCWYVVALFPSSHLSVHFPYFLSRFSLSPFFYLSLSHFYISLFI